MTPYKLQSTTTKEVILYVRVVSGCTGAHYIPIRRVVPINSKLHDGSIVRTMEAGDIPITNQ